MFTIDGMKEQNETGSYDMLATLPRTTEALRGRVLNNDIAARGPPRVDK